MLTIKRNGIWFKGQYAEALEKFEKGEEISLLDFRNGKWEPTTQFRNFMGKLTTAGIDYQEQGESVRSRVIKKK